MHDRVAPCALCFRPSCGSGLFMFGVLAPFESSHLLILQLTALLLPPSSVANGLAPPTPLTCAVRRHLFTPCHDPRSGRHRTPTPAHLGRWVRRRSAAVVGQVLQIASRLTRVAVLERPNADQNPASGRGKGISVSGEKKGILHHETKNIS